MYKYETEKKALMNTDGFRKILRMRERIDKLLETSAAFTMSKAIEGLTGDIWSRMACVDFFVEEKIIQEVPNPHSTFGQNRVFIKA
jgi:hypothetical protein